MNIKYVALSLGTLFSSGLTAAQISTSDDINQRFTQLEQRLINAEQQAKEAQDEIKALKQQKLVTQQNMVTTTVNTDKSEKHTNEPVKLMLSGNSDIKLYGDVEFNMDAASSTGSLISVNSSARNWAKGNNERWDINGRILLGFDGTRRADNGHFAGFSAQPLAYMTGKMDVDDAVFFFGREDDWKVKIGRFEAYDMFPLNQDTLLNIPVIPLMTFIATATAIST